MLRVVLLHTVIILAGMAVSSSGSGSVGRKRWSAGSFGFVNSLHRTRHAPFCAPSHPNRGQLRRRPAGGIARGKKDTHQPVSAEMVASDGGEGGSPAAQAYYERKREALSAWSEERRGRDLCERCRRARKMCLCSSLPARAMPTSTRFVILQHPAEAKKRITGTVPLVLQCLSNCRRIIMRSDYGEDELRRALGFEADADGGGEAEEGAGEHPPKDSSGRASERYAERYAQGRAATTVAGKPLLLFPCPGAEYLEDIAAADAARETSASSAPPPQRVASTAPSPPPPSSSGPPLVVVLIDGTWSQAKQLLSRYPFLSPQKPSVAGPGGRRLRFSSPGGPPAFDAPPNPGKGGGIRGLKEKAAELGGYAAEDVSVGGVGAEDVGQEGDGAVCRAVKFRSAGVSSYGFRREPTKECLSTLESVAYTLEVLEGTPEGAAAAAHLRKAFAAMVAMQLKAADEAGGRPRFVDRKGRTANRNSTPRRTAERESRAGGTRR
eukprot:g11189.t1